MPEEIIKSRLYCLNLKTNKIGNVNNLRSKLYLILY